MTSLLTKPAICASIVTHKNTLFDCDRLASQATEVLERMKVFNRFSVLALVIEEQGITLTLEAASVSTVNWVIQAYTTALAFETGMPLMMHIQDPKQI